MNAIFYQYWKEIIRAPLTLLLMIGMTVLFSVIMSSSSSSQLNVSVYSTELSDEQVNEKVTALHDEHSRFSFEVIDKTEAERYLTTQQEEANVQLEADTYTIHAAYEEAPIVYMIEPAIRSHYMMAQVEERGDRATVNQELFAFESSVMEEEQGVDYNLHSLFGFTLFFSFFTMGFTILTIIELKENGVWNRLLLTPTSKTQLYVSNLLVAFVLTFTQIAIVLTIFMLFFNVDFYGGFWNLFLVIVPYLFATMAFGIFMSGIVTSSQQLSAVIPLFATSFAMLGGTFWPLDVVESDIMLALSYMSPLRYGLEMMAGATYGGWNLADFFLPSAILIFMGLAFTGIGIRLMERKAI
ncbi:ABC transporter permease [Bacillus sp. Marseille-P3800]|uniref:ABC transporter permease n=1 Tax=Bacillus sp. Marseille-P3800 TaxID=2014782 RepID=UPI000C07DFB7|nr:ABC transporter permease [Bacillus sp. Marseille-P3800]